MKKIVFSLLVCCVVGGSYAENVFDSVIIKDERVQAIVKSDASYTKKVEKLADLVDQDARDKVLEQQKRDCEFVENFLQEIQQTDLEIDGVIDLQKFKETLTEIVGPDSFDLRSVLLLGMCLPTMLQPRNGTIAARDIYTFDKEKFGLDYTKASGVWGIAKDLNAHQAAALCMQLQEGFWNTFMSALGQCFEALNESESIEMQRETLFTHLINVCVDCLNQLRSSDQLLFIQLFIPQQILSEIDSDIVRVILESLDNTSFGDWLLADLDLNYPEINGDDPLVILENHEWRQLFIEKFVDYFYGRVFRKHGLI